MYLVTGASKGIGRAVATALAERGLQVLAVARSEVELKSLAAEASPHIRYLAVNLAVEAGIATLARTLVDHSHLDAIVHAAGSLVPPQPYASVRPHELVEHFRLHVAAPMAIYQALAARVSVRRLVTIDSYSATSPRDGWSAYSIVKAAARMSARCAAQELSDVDVIRVFPGAVRTQVVETVLQSQSATAQVFAAMQQRGELAEPVQVARFITALVVDGTSEMLRSQETWDYNSDADQAAVRSLS